MAQGGAESPPSSTPASGDAAGRALHAALELASPKRAPGVRILHWTLPRGWTNPLAKGGVRETFWPRLGEAGGQKLLVTETGKRLPPAAGYRGLPA
jgi:hypothetical protein